MNGAGCAFICWFHVQQIPDSVPLETPCGAQQTRCTGLELRDTSSQTRTRIAGFSPSLYWQLQICDGDKDCSPLGGKTPVAGNKAFGPVNPKTLNQTLYIEGDNCHTDHGKLEAHTTARQQSILPKETFFFSLEGKP